MHLQLMTNEPLDSRVRLAIGLTGGGWHPAAWREPGARPGELLTARWWTDTVREAQRGLADLVTIEDALALQSSDPEKFKVHVAKGRETYYKNCHFCHGDAMAGDGMYAHGLNPIPTNFTDAGNIPQLQESFLFWRIAKGGPGLPEEGGPWLSAMPAWEQFLTEEEIWNVILFLYDFTGSRPRALHADEAVATHEAQP